MNLGLNLDPNFSDIIVQIFKLLTVCFRPEIFFQVIDPNVIFFNNGHFAYYRRLNISMFQLLNKAISTLL